MRKHNGIATSGLTNGIPSAAYNAGYKLNTFSSTFQNDVDLSKTFNSGFNWYQYNPFGYNPDMSKVTGTTTGGPLVLLGDTVNVGGEICTAAVKGTSMVGKAFGGGGYFEASLKFDPTLVTVGLSNGWPAFWSLSIEKMTNPPTSDQWAGQAVGYEHYIEPDFFEYIRPTSTVTASYYGTLHDWSGISPSFNNDSNEPNSANIVPTNAATTQWLNYNNIGFLWVPATATTKGYAQYYYNRQPVGTTLFWTQYSPSFVPPVAGQTWKYGVMDTQHLSVVLSTCSGCPFTIQSVNVWQATNANNITA